MLSRIFIQRPKFAFVISIVITLGGLISMGILPINMYPEITPPQVQVTASYPGASAQVVEESVLRLIEERLNGVEDMMYIESTASNNGSGTITVYLRWERMRTRRKLTFRIAFLLLSPHCRKK